jgi:hypothetical protein
LSVSPRFTEGTIRRSIQDPQDGCCCDNKTTRRYDRLRLNIVAEGVH